VGQTIWWLNERCSQEYESIDALLIIYSGSNVSSKVFRLFQPLKAKALFGGIAIQTKGCVMDFSIGFVSFC